MQKMILGLLSVSLFFTCEATQTSPFTKTTLEVSLNLRSVNYENKAEQYSVTKNFDMAESRKFQHTEGPISFILDVISEDVHTITVIAEIYKTNQSGACEKIANPLMIINWEKQGLITIDEKSKDGVECACSHLSLSITPKRGN